MSTWKDKKWLLSQEEVDEIVLQQEYDEAEYNENMETYSQCFWDLWKILKFDDAIISQVMNWKYSKVEVIKDKKNNVYVYGTFRISPEGVSIWGLHREYPNADVRVVNYEWHIEYIEITEKYKIEKPK